ncbi:hypothetical protein HDU98_009370 [Podochytrium sp. JEL0797]|nr:hypothetical protein HDU98_009370 [Podochytrium sp. JEL0797]
METDDDEVSAKASPAHHHRKAAESDEESIAASSTAFWWKKEKVLNEEPPATSTTHKGTSHHTGSMFDPIPTHKDTTRHTGSMFEAEPISKIVVAEKHDVLSRAEIVSPAKTPEPVITQPPSILASSGMSSTMAALQQARSLLNNPAVEIKKDDPSPKHADPGPVSVNKLGPLPTLSKLPTLATHNKTNPFQTSEKPSEKKPSEPVSATSTIFTTPKETVLDMAFDEDIDAGFANYDAEADDDGDFLDLIMPKKNVPPILPLSAPRSTIQLIPGMDHHTKYEQKSSILAPPPTAAKSPALSAKESTAVSPKPALVEDEFETPIDEDFDNYDPDKDSEEDLSFLMKSTKKPLSADAPAVASSPKLGPGNSLPVKSVEPTPQASPKPFTSTKDEKSEKSEHSKAGLGPLGTLPSLSQKSSFPSSLPKPTAASLLPLSKDSTHTHANPSSAEKPEDFSKPVKKDSSSDGDISEDFDFEQSISDLLDDTDDVKSKKASKPGVGVSSSVFKDKISGAVSNKTSILDKFAESAMKILSDDTTSKRSAHYEDDFGAGNTDSEGETSNDVSAIGDQSPAFKKKGTKFLADSDSESDDLFRDDGVDLEIDNENDDAF